MTILDKIYLNPCKLILLFIFTFTFSITYGKNPDEILNNKIEAECAKNEYASWEVIIKIPEYQKLSEDEKQKIREKYFDDCLVKKIAKEDDAKEWHKFFITALETEKKAGLGNYLNCLSGDCKNGNGTLEYYKDRIYEGSFKDGLPNGQGTLTWPDGDKYVGQWKDGKMDGQGTYTWSSGQKYVGQWKDSKMDGQGTMTWPSGQKYEGQWKDDLPNGQGILTWPDGDKYEGQWKDGLPVD